MLAFRLSETLLGLINSSSVLFFRPGMQRYNVIPCIGFLFIELWFVFAKPLCNLALGQVDKGFVVANKSWEPVPLVTATGVWIATGFWSRANHGAARFLPSCTTN